MFRTHSFNPIVITFAILLSLILAQVPVYASEPDPVEVTRGPKVINLIFQSTGNCLYVLLADWTDEGKLMNKIIVFQETKEGISGPFEMTPGEDPCGIAAIPGLGQVPSDMEFGKEQARGVYVLRGYVGVGNILIMPGKLWYYTVRPLDPAKNLIIP